MPVSDYNIPRFSRYITLAKTANETLGNISATMIRFTAAASNDDVTGYKGTSASSETQGSGDTIRVPPGTNSGWIPCFNANQFSIIVAADDTLYVEIAQ